MVKVFLAKRGAMLCPTLATNGHGFAMVGFQGTNVQPTAKLK